MLSPKPSEPAKSISSSKCSVFPSSVMFFKLFMWSKVMILIEETKMSISDMTNSTWLPSQHACKARRRRGHISLSTTGPSTTLSKKNTHNGRVKFVQELHLRNLCRDPKQLWNLHSYLR